MSANVYRAAHSRLFSGGISISLDRSKEARPQGEGPRGDLASIRDAIREASGLGASVVLAEEAWNLAAEALEKGEVAEGTARLERASQLATEARARKVREIEDFLSAVEDHIALARTVGADPADAERHLGDARAAYEGREYARASELATRAERLAMLGQLGQIQKAMELREAQTRRAYAVVATNEPVVREAESYGLNVADARVLLRQARDVLARGDYLTGLMFARNAEEAVERLLPQIDEERRRRGIEKPSRGICGVCRSTRLHFYDNGWGRCLDCGSPFRWRGAGWWETIKGLLGP